MRSILHALILGLSLCVLSTGAPAQDEEAKKEPAHKDYRIFTSKDGRKTIEARVVARLDDERYMIEMQDGQKHTINIADLSASDQQFLEFWEPGAIVDFESATLAQVLEKMEYSEAELTNAGGLQIVTATVDGKDLKFVLASNRNFSALDPSAASDLGLELSDGKVNMRTPEGKTERTKQGTVKSLAIGDVELESVEFQVFDVAMLAGNVPASTAGLLGTDLLTKLNALVDLGGNRLFVKKGD